MLALVAQQCGTGRSPILRLFLPMRFILFAQHYAHAQHILIGHLNYEGVISVLDKIKALLDQRGLTTVTLRDYYGG